MIPLDGVCLNSIEVFLGGAAEASRIAMDKDRELDSLKVHARCGE